MYSIQEGNYLSYIKKMINRNRTSFIWITYTSFAHTISKGTFYELKFVVKFCNYNFLTKKRSQIILVPKFFYPNFFGPKTFLLNKISWTKHFFQTPKISSGPKSFPYTQNYFKIQTFFWDPKIILDPKWASMKDDIWSEETELLNLRLSKLARPRAKVLL